MLGKVVVTQPEDAHLPYRNLVGTLGYLAHTTRPDITFSVNVLTQHFKGWSHTHWIVGTQVPQRNKGLWPLLQLQSTRQWKQQGR